MTPPGRQAEYGLLIQDTLIPFLGACSRAMGGLDILPGPACQGEKDPA
jgi:hypothetical protein